MRFTNVQGVLKHDHSFSGHSKCYTLAEADAAIAVGAPTITDVAGDQASGDLVVTAVAAGDHMFRGVYTGKGGTGATTAVTNLSGNAAADGDVVLLQTLGECYALVNGNSVNIDASNDALNALMLGAGVFVIVNQDLDNEAGTPLAAGAILPGYKGIAYSLTDVTADGGAGKVFVNL